MVATILALRFTLRPSVQRLPARALVSAPALTSPVPHPASNSVGATESAAAVSGRRRKPRARRISGLHLTIRIDPARGAWQDAAVETKAVKIAQTKPLAFLLLLLLSLGLYLAAGAQQPPPSE